MQASQIKPVALPTEASHLIPDPRLARSAHAFEASLMGELLKPMQQTDGLTGDDEDSGSESALTGFATESLAQVISERGGLGIADRVLHELHAAGAKTGNQSGLKGQLASL